MAHDNIVMFKGKKDGLAIILDNTVEFDRHGGIEGGAAGREGRGDEIPPGGGLMRRSVEESQSRHPQPFQAILIHPPVLAAAHAHSITQHPPTHNIDSTSPSTSSLPTFAPLSLQQADGVNPSAAGGGVWGG